MLAFGSYGKPWAARAKYYLRSLNPAGKLFTSVRLDLLAEQWFEIHPVSVWGSGSPKARRSSVFSKTETERPGAKVYMEASICSSFLAMAIRA